MTDLDARVAELPKRYEELQKSGVETDTDPKSLIIKALQDKIAELQKPALHEPPTADEIKAAMQGLTMTHMKDTLYKTMQAILESFLQGRARPAQEEITDEQLWEIWRRLSVDMGSPIKATFVAYGRACIRASKGEKT